MMAPVKPPMIAPIGPKIRPPVTAPVTPPAVPPTAALVSALSWAKAAPVDSVSTATVARSRFFIFLLLFVLVGGERVRAVIPFHAEAILPRAAAMRVGPGRLP
jgi:hypothetical protein